MDQYYDFTLAIRCPNQNVLENLYKDLIPSDMLEHFEVGEVDKDMNYQEFDFNMKSGDKWFRTLNHIVTFLSKLDESKYKKVNFLKVCVEYYNTLITFEYNYGAPVKFNAYHSDDYRQTAREKTLEQLVVLNGAKFETPSNPYYCDYQRKRGLLGLRPWRTWEKVEVTRKGKM